jgi:putative endopeptidase
MHRHQPSRLLALLVGLLLANAIGQPFAAQVAPLTPGIDLTLMDRSVDPGDDFYRYANGRWQDTTDLPAGYSRYDPYTETADRVDEVLIDILYGLDPDSTTDDGKARSFFDQMIDENTRNEQGIAPIQPLVDDIMAISSIAEGLTFQPRAHSLQLQGIFQPLVFPNIEDSSVLSAYIANPDLSLPTFHDYFDLTPEGDSIREGWVDATAELLQELGYSRREARTAAEMVLAFETELANAMWLEPLATDADTHVWNVQRTLEELQDIAPAIDWPAYVAASPFPADLDVIYFDDIRYIEALDDILADAEPLTLQYLFASQLAWLSADYLTTEMFTIASDFMWGTAFDLEVEPDVYGFAYYTMLESFPDVFGQAYVEQAFPPAARADAEELVNHIIDAFRLRIQHNEWMSEATKAKAIEKLDLISIRVGYPDQWASYADVVIGDSAWETMQNIQQVTTNAELGQAGSPFDRDAWNSPAYEVNAWYYFPTNSITIPAGILQAPFYDPNASLAYNYGGIGMTIGHEITHAFDSDGAQFDGHGNLVFWWEQDDYDAFSELSAEVSSQYAAIDLPSGLSIDGDLTLGENIADLGGVQVAYDGLVLALEELGTPITREQQREFFIAYAQSSRAITTPEYEEWLLLEDTHSPDAVRAVEPLRHMDAFYAAFNITRTDDEYLPPTDRIVIW